MLPLFAAAVCQYLSKRGKTLGLMILSDYTLNNDIMNKRIARAARILRSGGLASQNRARRERRAFRGGARGSNFVLKRKP